MVGSNNTKLSSGPSPRTSSPSNPRHKAVSSLRSSFCPHLTPTPSINLKLQLSSNPNPNPNHKPNLSAQTVLEECHTSWLELQKGKAGTNRSEIVVGSPGSLPGSPKL